MLSGSINNFVMVVHSGNDKDSEKIFSDLDRAQKRHGSCFSYKNLVFGFLFLLFVFFVALCWGVSATGIFRVPIIAKFAYPEDPTPVRNVKPSQAINESNLFKSELDFSSGPTAQIEISENELTTLIRTPNKEGQVSIKQGQIAIDDTSAEIYGIVNITRTNTAVIRIDLVETNQDVLMNTLKVGYITLPNFLSEESIKTFAGENYLSLKSTLSSLIKNSDLGKNLKIDSVGLDNGKVIITVREAK